MELFLKMAGQGKGGYSRPALFLAWWVSIIVWVGWPTQAWSGPAPADTKPPTKSEAEKKPVIDDSGQSASGQDGATGKNKDWKKKRQERKAQRERARREKAEREERARARREANVRGKGKQDAGQQVLPGAPDAPGGVNRVDYRAIMEKGVPQLDPDQSPKELPIPPEAKPIEGDQWAPKKIYDEDLQEELSETNARRFSVVFFVSLPFTSLFSFGVLQSVNAIVYEKGNRRLPISHWVIVGANGVALSGVIAWYDTKKWEAYRKKHLQDLEFRDLHSRGPRTEPLYRDDEYYTQFTLAALRF